MKVGVLVTGDTSVRAAHSLAAHTSVDEVVVIGPARSKNFEVVPDAKGCDFLIGSGASAVEKAAAHGVPLIWDGEMPEDGVGVWGANPQGLTLALAARETDPRLVAVAHPSLEGGSDQIAPFPKPIGRLPVDDSTYANKRLAVAHTNGDFAACLVQGAKRSVAIVDDGAFLSGIALAAAIDIANETPKAAWDDALPYLKAAAAMGLVMAEDV